MDSDDRGKSDWTVGADVELNPEGFLGGAAIDPELSYLYGQTRVSFAGGVATRLQTLCRSRLEARGSLKYIKDAPTTVDSVVTTVRGSCIFNDQGGWGLLLRYYHGQDYYNLGFLNNISRFSIGVTYEQDGFMRFKRPKP